jgi:hypothetical protein
MIKSSVPEENGRGPGQLTPRAERYPIHTPVLYRANGDSEWSEGDTINISHSGVLFRAGKAIEPATMLEMRIVFPVEITGGAPANVMCSGPVVRRQGDAIAASIQKYRFMHE